MANLTVYREIDILLSETVTQELLSVCPERKLASTFNEMGIALMNSFGDAVLIELIGNHFKRVVDTLIYNFPDNIFWDFDHLLASLSNNATKINGRLAQEQFINHYCQKICDLLGLFGSHSKIKFRYVHDFTYGYDWAKWVKKDIENRRDVHPFSIRFMDSMLSRGKELLNLIEENDKKYCQLNHEGYRNPFSFSREPNDEFKLMRGLYKENLVPIKLWKMKTSPDWQKPFAKSREAFSEKVGIKPNIN